MTAPTDVDVAILGAGPKGVSLGVHLSRCGVRDLVVLERDIVVGTWRSAYAGTSPTRTGMYLSDTIVPGDCDISPLPRYAREHPDMDADAYAIDDLPKEVLQDYYRDAAAAAGVPVELGRTVMRVTPVAGGFAVLDGQGQEFTARCVVDATGIVWSKRWPRWSTRIPEDRCYHSIGHGVLGDRGDLTGARILVVGGGHATPDIAVRMAELGARVTMTVRNKRLQQQLLPYAHEFLSERFQRIYRRCDLPTRYRMLIHVHQSGPRVTRRSYEGLVDFLSRQGSGAGGHIEVALGTTVEGVRVHGDEIHTQLSNGWTRDFDFVICATGFHASLPHSAAYATPQGFWDNRVHGGYPIIDDRYRLRDEDSFFVIGYLAQLGARGPIDSILYDTQNTTRVVTAAVREALSRRLPPTAFTSNLAAAIGKGGLG